MGVEPVATISGSRGKVEVFPAEPFLPLLDRLFQVLSQASRRSVVQLLNASAICRANCFGEPRRAAAFECTKVRLLEDSDAGNAFGELPGFDEDWTGSGLDRLFLGLGAEIVEATLLS